jgi:hypothetical protein
LYEISLAFFTKAKPSIQLVVNGESVLSAINSPSYIIQHSSGYTLNGDGRVEHGTVTGISLLVILILKVGFFNFTFKVNHFDSLSWNQKECF